MIPFQIPPAVLRFHIQPLGGRRWRFWLPLFLLWPLIAILAVLFFPLILVALLLRFRGETGRILSVGMKESWKFACAMKGLHIEVEDKDQKVLIQLN